jgi:PKD repeat protein
MFKKTKKYSLVILVMSTIFLVSISSLNLHLWPLTTLASPIATFYVEATKTTDLDIDEEFWVIIKFKDFEQLWMWQAGLQWEPDKLECLEVVAFKPYYPESVFAVLAPTRSTAFIDGTIDNTAGKIYPPYAESLKAPGEGVTGTAGVGYPILKARFKVEAYFPDGTTLTPLETEWTAYPNVGTFLPHEDQPLTIYTKTPPQPNSPIADFSWSPLYPVINEVVTFDASGSQPGFNGTETIPITEYRWDFNGDGTFDKNETTPTTTWTYTNLGDYDVTLEVWAPGIYPPDIPDTNSTTKTITINPPTFYLDPSTIASLNVGDTFNITVKFKGFTDLYMWQAGLQWDPQILECTNVQTFKPFYPESVFAVLAPTRTTIFIEGAIDNVAGKIYPPYAESLTGPGGVTGEPGVGYNIMKVTFRVKAYTPEASDINFIGEEDGELVTCWSLYPNVAVKLKPAILNASITISPPPAPCSPLANFIWQPSYVIVNEVVTFDASGSQPGFNGTETIPITEYRWDFNGDGTFDKNETTPTTTWTYTNLGDYDVTLEVWAPGIYPPDIPDTNSTTKTITINPPTRTFVYIDPPTINAVTIDETIIVYIKIKDFAMLYGWKVGLRWNTTILNCTEVLAGPDFSEGVFNVLAPSEPTIFNEGSIDNINGILMPYSEYFQLLKGVNAAAGEAYNLMKITFKVKASGIADLHLYRTATYYLPRGEEGETIIRDMYTVILPEGNFQVEIITNSTRTYQQISDHTFNGPPANKISFKVYSAPSDGFINITIPKSLMWNGQEEWMVKVNGVSKQILEFNTNTHTFLRFEYSHKTISPYDNLIEIISPHAIPEFPLSWLLMTLLLAILPLGLLYRRKRR